MTINSMVDSLIKTISAGFLTGLALLAFSAPLHAQEGISEVQIVRKLYTQGLDLGQTPVTKQDLSGSGFDTDGSLNAAKYGGCVCTNLANVSMICEECDTESRLDYCYTHDRACQDAAQKGGIREHDTFFCTTDSD